MYKYISFHSTKHAALGSLGLLGSTISATIPRGQVLWRGQTSRNAAALGLVVLSRSIASSNMVISIVEVKSPVLSIISSLNFDCCNYSVVVAHVIDNVIAALDQEGLQSQPISEYVVDSGVESARYVRSTSTTASPKVCKCLIIRHCLHAISLWKLPMTCRRLADQPSVNLGCSPFLRMSVIS